jgi:hypothetical protein
MTAMKFITVWFLTSLLLATGLSSQQDPFDPAKAPKEITSVAWEKLITQPENYNGKTICVGGWISFQKVAFLFKDNEAREFNKEFSSVKFGLASQFLNLCAQEKVQNGLFEDHYVVIISKFQCKQDDLGNESIGEFVGPVRVSVRKGRLEVHSIFDPNAIWN